MIDPTAKATKGFRDRLQNNLIAIVLLARLFPDEFATYSALKVKPRRCLLSDPSSSQGASEKQNETKKEGKEGKENNSDRSHGDA